MLTKLEIEMQIGTCAWKLPKGGVPSRRKVGSSTAAVHSSSTSRRNDTVKKMAYAMPYVAKEQSAMKHFVSLHL